MSQSFENRRKHVRIYRNYILSYHLKGKGNIKYEMSQVNNISRGGINFTVTAPFEKGGDLVIEMKTPFLNDHVTLQGTVLESREKVEGLLYEIRVQFHGLTPEAEEILLKIEQYSSQDK